MNEKCGMGHTFAPTSDEKNSVTDGLAAVKYTGNNLKMPFSIALSLARLANDHDPGERQCFLPQQCVNKSHDELRSEGGEEEKFISEVSSSKDNYLDDQDESAVKKGAGSVITIIFYTS